MRSSSWPWLPLGAAPCCPVRAGSNTGGPALRSWLGLTAGPPPAGGWPAPSCCCHTGTGGASPLKGSSDKPWRDVATSSACAAPRPPRPPRPPAPPPLDPRPPRPIPSVDSAAARLLRRAGYVSAESHAGRQFQRTSRSSKGQHAPRRVVQTFVVR
eukprot:scaffold11312_cov69-Phaeocystis_antarctica.AAC.8